MYLRGVEGITSPLNPQWQSWMDGINKEEWQKMVDAGASALRHQEMTIKQGLRSAFPVDFHGHKTLAVNWSLEASDMGETIYKDLGYEVALMFYYTGEVWNFSLRSNQVDVSKLALKHGGGGHPGASGFREKKIDWLLKLRKKKES